MIMINYPLLILALIFAISTAQGQRLSRNEYEKKTSSASKLVIIEPNANTTLTANTTSTILIESQSITKSLRDAPVTTRTTFNCNGIIISVESELGVPTNYTVDPRLNGDCTVIAEVPNNPNFIPSEPLQVEILNPLYYEGTDETAFHVGQSLPIFVRAADDAKLSIDFVITCGSVVKSIPIVTSTNTIFFVLTPDLEGDCTFNTPSVPANYIPIDTVSVTISQSIFFLTPAQNTQYAPGSTISATLFATDGNNTIDVTVQLTCNNILVESKTQNIQTIFSFAPNDQIYGTCELSIDDDNLNYYAEEIVTVTYRSVLSFVLPNAGAVVPPGTIYFIQVNGTSGTSSIDVSVAVNCQVGGSFTETVSLGVSTSFTLGTQYQGICFLVATTTSAPYFSSAKTSIFAFTPLDPTDQSKIARSFLLSGRIFELTQPY
jgi:hypothetical protein